MRLLHRLGLLVFGSFALVVVFALCVRPWFLSWGATDAEQRRRLPGDEIIADAGEQNTRAITIERPIEEVWPWLSQLGQDRAGFYSYQRLENLVGCEMPAATTLLPGKQAWSIGDKLWMYPPNKAGGVGFATLRVLEPGRVLAFATRRFGTALDQPEDGSWSFVLEPLDAASTRLLIRGRAARGRTAVALAFDHEIFDPMHFAMERRMMVGIARTAAGDPPSSLLDDMQLALWVISGVLVLALAIAVIGSRRHARRAFFGFMLAAAIFQVLTLGQPPVALGIPIVAALVLSMPSRFRQGTTLAAAPHMIGRFTYGFVFGCFLLIVGTAMALELLLGISIPVIRAAIAFALVVWGARALTRAWSRPERMATNGEAWLSDREFAPTAALARDARYDVVFGRGVVDLTRMAEPAADVTVSVDTVFGSAVVKVDPGMPYDVIGHAAFGEVRMPDHTSNGMGSSNFQHSTDHPARLHLRLSSVFGSCQVVEVPRQA